MKGQFDWKIAVVLVLLFLACGTKTEQPKFQLIAEQEPNDAAAQALVISSHVIAQGFIGAPKDQDWYKLTIPADSQAIVRAELSGVPGINLKMELFDANNDKLIEVDKEKEGFGETISNYGLTPGDYFLRVRELWMDSKERKFNDTTAYQLRIQLMPARPEFEFEPNNRAIKANMLKADQPVSGYISPYQDVDWYKIVLPPDQNRFLSLQLTGVDNVDLEMAIYDPIEAELMVRNANGKGEGETIFNLGVQPELEYYSIAIKAGKWQCNEDSSYHLTASFMEFTGKMEQEPNDRPVRATRISSGDTLHAYIDSVGDVDWYQMQNYTLFPQVARIIALGVPKIDLKMTVFDETEQAIWTVNEGGELENEIISNIGLPANSNYLLKVENLSKSGNIDQAYKLMASINPLQEGDEYEPNNDGATATQIQANSRVKGFIHPSGDVDFYRLDLSNKSQARVRLTLKGIIKVNTDLVVYDEFKQIVAEANSRPSEATEYVAVTLVRGVYLIKVYDDDGKQSNYRDPYELIVLVD